MSDESQNPQDKDPSDLVKPSLDEIIEDNSLEEILKNDSLDRSTKRAIIAKISGFSELFYGPLPHPKILAGYEKVLPGSADRILSLTEKQAEHRREIEKKLVTTDTLRTYLGLGTGFIIALVGLGGAIYLGINDKTVVSGILGSTTLAGLVAVFVRGSQQRKAEIEQEKQEDE